MGRNSREELKLRRTCRPGTPCTLLVIGPDADIAEALKATVREREAGCFMVHVAPELVDAVPILDGLEYDAVLLHVDSDKSQGLATLQVAYKLADKRAPILVVADHYDAEMEMLSFEIGAKEYLVKPLDNARVLMTVRHAILRFRHTQAEAAELRETGEIIRSVEPMLKGEPQVMLHEAANSVFEVAQRIMGSGA